MDFPAYFYEYENDLGLATPYVGSIDLCKTLPGTIVPVKGMNGYRIPPKGQLQLLIKNPSKTPIKVFLLPYDFSDMPPGHKTFLRQKSYVVGGNGGVASGATSAKGVKGKVRSLSGPSSPSSTIFGTQPVDIQHRPPLLTRTSTLERLSLQDSSPLHPTPDRLRYAVHLQIQSSPHSGRLYVTNSMRVVFSHRTPETDERLRVVVEGPTDPKYTPIEKEGLGSGGGVKRLKKTRKGASMNSTPMKERENGKEFMVVGKRQGSLVGGGEVEVETEDESDVKPSDLHLEIELDTPNTMDHTSFVQGTVKDRIRMRAGKRRGWSTNEAIAAGVLPPLPPPSTSSSPSTATP
jgi:hypothetical protein